MYRILRYRQIVAGFAFLALPLWVMASESPLYFESIEASGKSSIEEEWTFRERLGPSTGYPYNFYQPLGPLLDPYFRIVVSVLVEEDSEKARSQAALSLHLAASYEIYWDGELIGRNGKFDTNGVEEIPGRSYNTFALPAPFEPGSRHELIIEGYHTHGVDNGHFVILDVRTMSEMIDMGRTTGMTYTLYLGFALFGIYLVAYYIINRREPQYLFLGLSCLLFGLYALNKLLYYQLNVSYPKLDWIGAIGGTINILLSVTAPISVLLILGFRHWGLFVFAAAPFLVSRLFPELQIVPVGFYLCGVLAFAGVVVRRKHALHCLIVSLALIGIYELPFLRYNQGIGYGVLMLYLLLLAIVLLNRESKERTKAELRNSRLQIELLKSKVQPHFVLNSLTSAIEWIETNPKEGARLIQELAKEFELLAGMSDKSRISVATELESCRAYLRIMEYRKKAKYELKLSNVRPDDTIPPALFRNLLENAITHNVYGQEHVRFELDQSEFEGKRRFCFSSPLTEAVADSWESDLVEGTGIRYIKARLAESYEQWSFKHGPSGAFWRTEILMPSE